MENKTDIIEMLTETKGKLDTIKELNKEIHTALDVIEKRRNNQQTAAGGSGQVVGDVNELKTLNREVTNDTAATLSHIDDDNPSESSTPTENMMEEASQNVNGESNRDEKVKGILKAPKVGSKHSYGFKERLDLNFNHVMYGSKLKRNAVEIYQDNRLCEEFGLEPNIGNVYESRRPPSPVTNEATAPTHNLTKVPVNDDCNKQVTLDAREGSVTERSKPKEKQVAISKRQSQSRSKTTPSAEGAVESKVKKKQTEKRELEKSQPRSEMKVKVPSRDGAGGQQLQDQMAGMLGSLQSTGVQLQLSRDTWLNTITEHANVDDQQKEGLRQYMGTFVDSLFGKGETINVLEFLNLTKDKFMEKMFKMYSVDGNLSEEDKHQVTGLLSRLFFDENGKINMSKCVQAGQNMGIWNEQFQAMMGQTLGQAESRNDDIADDDEADDDEAEDNESDKSHDTSFGHSAAALTYKTEENDTDENDSEVERIDVNPDVWVQYANDEVVKGKVARDVRESGMDTVICLDLSHSMRGYAWEQATTFIKNFVEGIQNSTLMDTSYEHIALVTYGSETRVQQHLTCDYVEIFRKLYRLKPSGPSPMYAGLQMVHAAILGAGMVFKCNGYRMYPRVFLITDGRATPAGMVSGPDVCLPELLQQEQFPILKVVKELHDKYHVTINTVPVGECDATLLEKIVHISKGKMISPEDWRMQSRVFKNYLAAAKLCGGPFAKLLAPGLKTMMLDAHNASPEDKIQMEEFLHRHEQEEDEDSDDQETDTFPPLGSRVRGHNPGSTIMTESMAIGTITKHFSDGHIGITWDEPSDDGKLREKKPYQPGARNVIVVDEPRVLKADEMIAEGCRVTRGKDWCYPDQDGGPGNLGSVYSIKPNGIVSVRWDNGSKNTYKFGAEGKFDLEIVTSGQKKEIVQKIVPKDTAVKPPNDDLTEEMRVQKMNERNRSIYDMEMSEPTGGATSQVPADDSVENNKNKRNSQPVKNMPSDNNINGKNNTLKREHAHTIKSSTAENISTSFAEHNPKHSVDGNTKGGSGNCLEDKVEWMWLDGETWRPYSPDIIEKIESGYKRNPRGTTVIRLDEIMYRVVFPRMEKINIETKEKFTVVRKGT